MNMIECIHFYNIHDNKKETTIPNLNISIDSNIEKTKIDNEIKNKTCVMDRLKIKEVIFNNPATIIYWKNGDKTVVKCGEKDIYDPEKGLAIGILKYLYGNNTDYHKLFKNYIPERINKDHDNFIETIKLLMLKNKET